MSYVNTFDQDLLDKTRMEAWRKELGVTNKYLLNETIVIIEKLIENLNITEKEFIQEYGEFGILKQISLFIKKQINRVEKSL